MFFYDTWFNCTRQVSSMLAKLTKTDKQTTMVVFSETFSAWKLLMHALQLRTFQRCLVRSSHYFKFSHVLMKRRKTALSAANWRLWNKNGRGIIGYCV